MLVKQALYSVSPAQFGYFKHSSGFVKLLFASQLTLLFSRVYVCALPYICMQVCMYICVHVGRHVWRVEADTRNFFFSLYTLFLRQGLLVSKSSQMWLV